MASNNHEPHGLGTGGAGSCTAVVGLQWGDEGKGKLVDVLASSHDAIVRYNGGANAGHSVVVAGERYALHLVPSGILCAGRLAIIGNGVVVDPEVLLRELDGLQARGVDVSGMVVSDRAHVVMPYHKAEDELRERILRGSGVASGPVAGGVITEIGTTKRGIGPTYAEKVQRSAAVRVGDLLRPDVLARKIDLACRLKNALFGAWADTAGEEPPYRFDPGELLAQSLAHGERLRGMIRDTTYLLHDLIREGKSLLFEGANATLLDVDHGTYPYVTSSNCTALGIGTGTGVPGRAVGRVVGVMKAYTTRVGGGPMPTELREGADVAIGDRIRERGREYGTTTGRPRRVGWLDLVAVRYAAMVNGVTELTVTMMDVLAGFDELRVCTAYRLRGEQTARFPPDGADLAEAVPLYETFAGFREEIDGVTSREALPPGARAYIDRIESFVGVPVRVVSVGPDRAQTIRVGAVA